MAAQASDISARGRIDFTTTDSGVAIDYFQNAYRTNMKFSGVRDGQTYAHSRLDAGLFAIDDVRLPLRTGVVLDPFNSLVIVNLHAGRFERECAGVNERFVGGDVFIDADPVLPAILRMFETQLQTIMLDLSVLAQVAASSPTRKPGPIRFTRFQPISRGAATHWKNSVTYLTDLLAHPEPAAQPLIRGSAARLLAATALGTFPNTAITEPTAQDRRDATSATVRRAIAFIDQHPDADISVADIAAAANVSIRAVQFAFRRHLDTTPMQHLRTVRLDHVHRELLATDPSSGTTVTDIATRWGFYNHSRFATRYRRAYGVNPRDTLRSDRSHLAPIDQDHARPRAERTDHLSRHERR
jgi:AraC-like DNA-binding protein